MNSLDDQIEEDEALASLNYLKPNRTPKDWYVKTNAKNYLQETLEKYEKYLIWDNGTYFEDRKLLYMSAERYCKSHTHAEFVRLLDWMKSKEKLHPKQFIKVLNK